MTSLEEPKIKMLLKVLLHAASVIHKQGSEGSLQPCLQ